jgi:hypothetical protein
MAGVAGLRRAERVLAGQCNQVALEAHGFDGQFESLVDLVEVAADTQQ